MLIIILASYSIASFGVSLNYFYCCGKLKTISFAEKSIAKACKGSKKKNCCRTEKVTVKLKTDQKASGEIHHHFDTPISPAILHLYDFILCNDVTTTCQTTPLYKRPPPIFFPKRNVLYCVYRI